MYDGYKQIFGILLDEQVDCGLLYQTCKDFFDLGDAISGVGEQGTGEGVGTCVDTYARIELLETSQEQCKNYVKLGFTGSLNFECSAIRRAI